MKFFSMWYYSKSQEDKQIVKQLLKEGRLEIANGGWAMHDEACTTYDDMIDNMMKGHQFLLKEFNYIPRIGWQVDPFGHSVTNARLFAEMGFDAMFLARIDSQDRDRRLKDKEMEFVWRPSFSYLG